MRIFFIARHAGLLHKFVNTVRKGRFAFLARDEGAVLVEAAIVIPILLMMFVGMVEFSQAFTARRKVVAVVSTVADLVAQRMSVGASDLVDIVSISNSLMAPFSAAPLGITIASVGFDANNNIATLWSCSWSSISGTPSCTEPQQGCSASGASFTLPAGLLTQAGNSIIVAQATYNYKPPIGQFLLGGLTFQPVAYFKPRLVPCVAKL